MVENVQQTFGGQGMQPAHGPMPKPPPRQEEWEQQQQAGQAQDVGLAIDAYLTGDRLQSAAKKLRLGAAPGPAGVPAAAFRQQPVLDATSHVLCSMARAPAQPPAVQCGQLHPSYKGRGSQLDATTYRKLVVSGVLHKLYANCVLKYALDVLQAGGHLTGSMAGHAGFLPGRNTLQNCFALSHMVHHQLHVAKQPLYVAFLFRHHSALSVPSRPRVAAGR
jgi:hypothetical protein